MSKSILETNGLDKIATRKDIKFTVNNSNTKSILINESSINNNIKKFVKEEEKTTFNQKQRNINIRNQKNRIRYNKERQELKRGQWSISEDKLLEQWIKEVGPRKWNQCGRFIQGRSGKQCREHWNNCLNPELIKGEWTSEEDFLIMYFYEQCNGSWKKIIPLFNGRTENSIKNKFFSQLRKIATKDASREIRKECAKIKLEELKKFLNEAISEAKKEFLYYKKMNEEELNNYINRMKMKIQKKRIEENENSEVLSTNLGDLENTKNNVMENNEKEINFIGKKRAAENQEINNVLSSLDNKNSNIEAKKYKKELSDIKNNEKVNDNKIIIENLNLKTDFNNLDNKNNNFNNAESMYKNDKLNKFSITQDSSQLLNVFNNNNILFDDYDCDDNQSENKEDSALYSFELIPNNLIDYQFRSKLNINSINDNNTIFNNDIDLFEE